VPSSDQSQEMGFLKDLLVEISQMRDTPSATMLRNRNNIGIKVSRIRNSRWASILSGGFIAW